MSPSTKNWREANAALKAKVFDGRTTRPVAPGVAIRLTRDTRGMCVVWLCFDGKEVPVIRDNGDIISHYVEPLGIATAVREATTGAQR